MIFLRLVGKQTRSKLPDSLSRLRRRRHAKADGPAQSRGIRESACVHIRGRAQASGRASRNKRIRFAFPVLYGRHGTCLIVCPSASRLAAKSSAGILFVVARPFGYSRVRVCGCTGPRTVGPAPPDAGHPLRAPKLMFVFALARTPALIGRRRGAGSRRRALGGCAAAAGQSAGASELCLVFVVNSDTFTTSWGRGGDGDVR